MPYDYVNKFFVHVNFKMLFYYVLDKSIYLGFGLSILYVYNTS